MSADLQFKQLIDRILRCREAEDAAKEDTKEVYAELKALGYDKTSAGAFVAELRQKDKNPDKFSERNATLDLYRDAYERAGASRAHTHTREGNEYAAAKGAANPFTTGEDHDADSGKHVRRSDDEQRDAARVSGAVGRGEGADEGAQGQGSGTSGADRHGRPVPRTVDCQDEDGRSGHVGREARHEIAHSPLADLPQPSAPEEDSPPAQSSGAAIPDADVPAFLKTKKTAADYRPHCQRPDLCAASGLHHCYSCKKAMADSEAA